MRATDAGDGRSGLAGPGLGGQPGARHASLHALFAIDLRSLALFRVAIAAAIGFDLADRSRDLVAHYTDLGVLPAATAAEVFGAFATALVHAWLSGSVAAEVGLFVLAATAGLALLVGWYTRAAALASWLLLVSLQARNPYLAGMGGDMLLRILLFWGLFLPLGARASVDAWRRGELGGPGRVLSAASVALLVQLAVFYVATGLHKSGPLWRQGSAVHYALHLDYWATALGAWLRRFPGLLVAATHGTRAVEVFGPLLAFSPWRTAELRMAAIGLFVAFHLSLAVALDIGPFPIFSLVAWTAFLPSRLWDVWLPGLLARLRGRGAGAPERPAASPAVLVRAPRWLDAGVALLLVYVVLFAALDVVRSVYGQRWVQLPRAVTVVGSALRINQHWRMFAPDPPRADTWPALVGRLADGRLVDPLRDAPPLLEKPERLSGSYPSFRWRLYLLAMNSEQARDAPAHTALIAYLCRSWNAREDAVPLVELRIVRVLEPSPPSDSTLRRSERYASRCPDPLLPREAGASSKPAR